MNTVKKFFNYFENTWLMGNYSLNIWNHFRMNIRTNNICEGYNSRLDKRTGKKHLNIYELILVFKSEQINKEAYILQIDGGQQSAKRRRR